VPRESKLNTREATVPIGQKELEQAHTGVLACELATDI
jgi:hypothetical protein